VAQPQLEALVAILRERGPILQARPIRTPCVGLLYTDPHDGERARTLFESVTRQRLERFGTNPVFALVCTEEEENVARALQHLLRARPTVIRWLPRHLPPVRRTRSAELGRAWALIWSGSWCP